STDASASTLSSGIYMLTVTDNNDCVNFTVVMVDNNNAPVVTFGKTHVSCFGGSDGKLKAVVVSGNPPYGFEWSNGATSALITGLEAGPYEVTVTDNNGCRLARTTILFEPSLLSISASTTNAGCSGYNGTATATANGGVPPYSYWWSAGQAGATAEYLESGVYRVTVTDFRGCTLVKSVSVNNINAPVIVVDTAVSSGCGQNTGSIALSVSGGNLPYDIIWSNGATTEDISGLTTGNYTVTVSGSNGCKAAESIDVTAILPLSNPICLVTVDEEAGKNLIVWEPVQTTGISHYNIYRESTISGRFHKIGTRPADSLSIYFDTISDPDAWSWHYKLSVTDDCGNTSNLSEPGILVHKTIHLVAVRQAANEYRLVWNPYFGFPFDRYYIYRHNNSTGLFLIDSVSNTTHAYTDNPSSEDGLYYFIEVRNQDVCQPSGGSKTVGNYNTSRSNRSGVAGPDAIGKIVFEKGNILLFPNPNNGIFNIVMEFAQKEDVTVQISDAKGCMVKRELLKAVTGFCLYTVNVTGLSPGIYYIRISTSEAGEVRKVVIQ
ncbi:MAG: T9SS type A sorting domain-containing protein, partial [Bacteroidetes bacterium]|nr:T9SS type A sorting domain-containing protein [Bacteroidota bacterium]